MALNLTKKFKSSWKLNNLLTIKGIRLQLQFECWYLNLRIINSIVECSWMSFSRWARSTVRKIMGEKITIIKFHSMLLLHICQHRVVTFVTFSIYSPGCLSGGMNRGFPTWTSVLWGYRVQFDSPQGLGVQSFYWSFIYQKSIIYLIRVVIVIWTQYWVVTGIENSRVIM